MQKNLLVIILTFAGSLSFCASNSKTGDAKSKEAAIVAAASSYAGSMDLLVGNIEAVVKDHFSVQFECEEATRKGLLHSYNDCLLMVAAKGDSKYSNSPFAIIPTYFSIKSLSSSRIEFNNFLRGNVLKIPMVFRFDFLDGGINYRASFLKQGISEKRTDIQAGKLYKFKVQQSKKSDSETYFTASFIPENIVPKLQSDFL